jgi:hypothetical protein
LTLDSLGNFGWAKRLGGTSYDDAWSLALDSFDNIYTTGTFKQNPLRGLFLFFTILQKRVFSNS